MKTGFARKVPLAESREGRVRRKWWHACRPVSKASPFRPPTLVATGLVLAPSPKAWIIRRSDVQ